VSTQKGRQAEERAVRFLRRKGYRILARNVRMGRGELDIIARNQDVLAFVEVKLRDKHEAALLAMHADKCARMISAARAWVGRYPKLGQLQSRFDLIILSPGMLRMRIEHMEDIIRIT